MLPVSRYFVRKFQTEISIFQTLTMNVIESYHIVRSRFFTVLSSYFVYIKNDLGNQYSLLEKHSYLCSRCIGVLKMIAGPVVDTNSDWP